MSIVRISLIGGAVAATAIAGFLAAPKLAAMLGGNGADGYQAPPPQMRRLTEDQFRNSVADVFSPEIRIVGRFEPDVRVDGLAAVGSGLASISASGYEQYYAMAG